MHTSAGVCSITLKLNMTYSQDNSYTELLPPPQRINIRKAYNPSPKPGNLHGTIPLLAEILKKDRGVVVGDFNRHHPYWSGSTFAHQHREADTLLSTLNDNRLRLLPLPGTPTGK